MCGACLIFPTEFFQKVDNSGFCRLIAKTQIVLCDKHTTSITVFNFYLYNYTQLHVYLLNTMYFLMVCVNNCCRNPFFLSWAMCPRRLPKGLVCVEGVGQRTSRMEDCPTRMDHQQLGDNLKIIR